VHLTPAAVQVDVPKEVEAQLGNVRKVAFIEQPLALASVGDGQIEAPPIRQLLRRGVGQVGPFLVRHQRSYARTAKTNRRQLHAEHIATVHDLHSLTLNP
jgi:hypothetical protein